MNLKIPLLPGLCRVCLCLLLLFAFQASQAATSPVVSACAFADLEETYLELPEEASRYMNAYQYALSAHIITGVTHYDWQLHTSADFSGTVALQVSTETPMLTLTTTQLISGEKYYVRIRGRNATTGQVGAYTSATTLADSYFYNALHPVSMVRPLGCQTSNGTKTIASHTLHATGVYFQVATDPAFINIVDVSGPYDSVRYDPALPGQKKVVYPSYYARVWTGNGYVDNITNPDAYGTNAQWVYDYIRGLIANQSYYIRVRAYRGELQAGYWHGYESFAYCVPPVTPPLPRVTVDCGKALLDVATEAPVNTRYYFQLTADGTASEFGKMMTVTKSGTYYLRTLSALDTWSAASQVTVNLAPLPADPPAPFLSYGNGSATLTPKNPIPAGITYYWQQSALGTSTDYTGALTVTSDGVYYLRARNNTTGCWSEKAPAITVVLTSLQPISRAPDVAMNYVVENTVQVAGIRVGEQVMGLTAAAVHQQISYLDGLGRPIQQVITQGSPGVKDIVQPITYNEYGQQAISYLPYTSGTNGQYKADALTGQAQFYKQTPGVTLNDQPFAHTVYEDSPLAFVTEQGSIGKPWSPTTQGGSGKTMKAAYRTNTDGDAVRQWTNTGSGWQSDKTYPAGELMVSELRDTENHPIWEFTNKRGQVVLKRTEEGTNVLDTYSLFDDMGLLQVTIPPKGVAELKASGNWQLSNAFLRTWCYSYRYDARKRMIEQWVPGATSPTVAVYNKLDEAVYTQDAHSKSRQEWQVIKYDVMGRVVYTGIVKLPGVTRESLQVQADAFSGPAFESRSPRATFQYYTNVAYPVLADRDSTSLYTVNYYDDHDFNNDGVNDVPYVVAGNKFVTDPSRAFPSPQRRADGSNWEEVLGLPTSTKSKELATGKWLRQSILYDSRYQPVQVQTNHHQGGNDFVTTQFDFAGKVVKSLHFHTNPQAVGTRITMASVMPGYDHGGRPKVLTHLINEDWEDRQLPQRVAQLGYNELGQVTSQVVGNPLAGNQDLQKMDFSYTIQGWLAGINNVALDATGENDLFGMEFTYQEATNAGSRYDGTISKVRWRSTLDGVTRAYGYNYDALNRLTKASYSHNNPKLAETFSLEVPEYDLNGNIRRLRRNNLLSLGSNTSPSFGLVDDLTYNYRGNQITSVTDKATASTGLAGDFVKRSTAGEDYRYDASGNVQEDKNRGIASIVYNELNLPQYMYFDNTQLNYIEYQYDGAGNKLVKKLFRNGSLQTKTDYIGSMVYENDELQYMSTPTGRVLSPKLAGSSRFEYEYHYVDQVGNLRVAFREGPVRSYLATMETGPTTQPIEEKEFSNIATTRNEEVAFAGRYSSLTNTSQPIGPMKTLTVGKGDRVAVKVNAYYKQASQASGISLVAYLNRIKQGGAAVGSEAGNQDVNLLSVGLAYTPPLQKQAAGIPTAFLRYIVYDKERQFVKSETKPVTLAAQNGWEELSLSTPVEEDGFVQILVANESSSNVWFDHLAITHQESMIVQENHYDPFGLNLSGIEREGNYPYQFNSGSEKQKDVTGNGYFYETDFRGYDPQLGRFRGIDLLGDMVPGITPYQFSYNNPIMGSDPSGLVVLPMVIVTATAPVLVSQVAATSIIASVGTAAAIQFGAATLGMGGPCPKCPDPSTAKAGDTAKPYDLTYTFDGQQWIAEGGMLEPVEATGKLAPDKTARVVGMARRRGVSGGAGNGIAKASIGIGAPGTLESMIPIWGSGRAAINDFQNGDYVWGTVNTALAVSDVFLVKSLATGIGKAVWKAGLKEGATKYFGIGMSHNYGATVSRLRKLGVDMSGYKHHWLISQEAMAARPWLKPIGNQTWNLTRFNSQVSHMRWAHGNAFPSLGLGRIPLWQAWYPISSTPTWFKSGIVSYGGRAIQY